MGHLPVKSIPVLLLFIGCILCLRASSQKVPGEPGPAANRSFSGEVIRIDSGDKAKQFPFDTKFVLQSEIQDAKNIVSVSLWRVTYRGGGGRLLKHDKWDKNKYTNDYAFSNDEYKVESNKLTIGMPALKPNKDFDIMVLKKGSSGNNYKMITSLNQQLASATMSITPVPNGIPEINPGSDINALFKKLWTATNSFYTFNTARIVYNQDISSFYAIITQPTLPYYVMANDPTSFVHPAPLSEPELTLISSDLHRVYKKFKDINKLEHINFRSLFDKILMGKITVGGSFTDGPETDPYLLSDKINNIKNSIIYFDSLYQTINELIVSNGAGYGPVRDHIKTIIEALNQNKGTLSKQLSSIDAVINNNTQEAVWLSANTGYKDLQTRGASIMTLDLGIANIWATDLDNKPAYIPKLYYGVNIYFRGVDKNINRKELVKCVGRVKGDNDTLEDHRALFARRTVFQRISFTAGFTIGSLNKDNFDNFFGGSSLLLGPGYLVTKTIRVSTGVSFLKRSQLNPLLTEKKFTTGYYITTSIDLDLINSVKVIKDLL